MTASRNLLTAMILLTGMAMAAPPACAYSGNARGHWYGPSVRIYYGSPYWGGWGGWGWPAYAWPGAYASSYHYNYNTPRYRYVPPYYVYGPPGVLASTGGVVYIEREAGSVSTQQPEPAPAAAPPPVGTQWWYLCSSPRGAYPYVRECPGGWERVPAMPPDLAK